MADPRYGGPFFAMAALRYGGPSLWQAVTVYFIDNYCQISDLNKTPKKIDTVRSEVINIQ